MGAEPTSMQRVPALDGVRGVALFAILLYHSEFLDGAFLSVDMFFALSGFLITSLLRAEWHRHERISLRSFWARRARRLLPALGVFMLGIALYCLAFAEPSQLADIRGKAIATVAYVANWHAVVVHESYFDQFGPPSPLRHAWTLAVEEQFYLVWPLMVVAILAVWRRRPALGILVTALSLGALSALAMAWLFTPGDPNRAYYGTDTRAYALFAGIAVAAGLAIWGPARSRRGRAIVEVIGVGAVGGVAWMWITADAQAAVMYRGGFLLHSVALAAILVAAANPIRGFVAWLFSFRALVLLGLISYGVYLWHWPINLVVDEDRVGFGGWPLFVLRTAIAVAFGTASYLLVEQPIRRGAGTARQWRVALPAVTVVVLLSLVGATAAARPAADLAGIDATDALSPNTRAAMRERATLVDAVVPVDTPRVLVVGDSVSLTLAAGATPRADAPFAVVSASMVGCGIAGGIPLGLPRFSPASVCDQWPAIWRRAIEVFRPTAIVLLVGPWDVQNHRIHGNLVRTRTPELRRHLLERLARAQSIARDAGVPLVLLTTPCFTPDTEGAGAQFASLGNPARIRWFNQVLRDAAARDRSSTHVVDLGSFVCPGGRDRERVDGVTLRADGIHFTRAGAAATWAWLGPRLVRVLDRAPAAGATAAASTASSTASSSTAASSSPGGG